MSRISSSGILLAILLLLAGCAGRGNKTVNTVGPRSFPQVTIPEAYTDEADRIAYGAGHFWDPYLAGEGATDSAYVLGVARNELEQNLANYIAILGMEPLPEATRHMEGLFKGVSAVQKRDSTSHFFDAFSELVSSYLYDPNSPLRDEDLYLPYVSGLAESPYTPDNMRAVYRYQALMCSLNQRGSVAPDIKARTASGSQFTLHGIKAPFTLLFFSNPGCSACREMMETIQNEITPMFPKGTVAVANIYIDDELDAWRKYVDNYPEEWYTGYDFTHEVRDEQTYSVRAIPSLYLLDSEKRIIYKDAPVEKILVYLQSLDY
ncbi:MAG: DUF5106 domain-containing protein [Bacteroidales bacterium]|nr:DUF5106 domain-containing protein [Bacteroidales bacterium]